MPLDIAFGDAHWAMVGDDLVPREDPPPAFALPNDLLPELKLFITPSPWHTANLYQLSYDDVGDTYLLRLSTFTAGGAEDAFIATVPRRLDPGEPDVGRPRTAADGHRIITFVPCAS